MIRKRLTHKMIEKVHAFFDGRSEQNNDDMQVSEADFEYGDVLEEKEQCTMDCETEGSWYDNVESSIDDDEPQMISAKVRTVAEQLRDPNFMKAAKASMNILPNRNSDVNGSQRTANTRATSTYGVSADGHITDKEVFISQEHNKKPGCKVKSRRVSFMRDYAYKCHWCDEIIDGNSMRRHMNGQHGNVHDTEIAELYGVVSKRPVPMERIQSRN